LSSMSLS